jgi:hypothetical protein
MRYASGWALACLGSLAVAGVLYVLGRLEGDRLIANGQGWEMAFYLSPLVFLAIDGAIVLGAVLGVVGLVLGPGVSRRTQSAAAVLLSVGTFLVLPWR